MAQTYRWAGGGLTVADGDISGIVALQVGHATDTTLSRKSAGVLQIEANEIYMQNGTDVAVADGGTGASTAQDARTNLLPSKTGNALKVLRVNAGETDFELAAASGGPATQLDANGTTLDVDAIADGEFLIRSGTTIIGSAGGGGGGISAGYSAGLNFWGAW